MANSGKLTVTTFLTLDGVYQAPGGPDEDRAGGFQHGGWVVPYFDDDMFSFINQVFTRADTFMLGRKTYEIFASYWPRITDENDPVASALNRLPKYVASRTLKQADWRGTTIVRDGVKEVSELKRRYPREVQVHGSGDLVQALLANELVDELNLLLFPVALGAGKRLFGSDTAPSAFAPTGTRTTSMGVVITTYRRAGKPTYGTAGLETA
jgi:dihydrofolate reductase